MAVVIPDTSPINYLVLIGEISLLPRLYGKILIPDAVLTELRETLLLMDDSVGRSEAARLGLRTTGTLGVIRAAAQKRMLDLEPALERLSQTNFYLPARLAAFLRAEARARESE
jgi:predicted nucleic acid-binding protein